VKWAEHVSQRVEKRNTFKILVKKRKDVDWNQLAQDSVQKQTLVKTMLNLQVIF
jgi:hypothetical protein